MYETTQSSFKMLALLIDLRGGSWEQAKDPGWKWMVGGREGGYQKRWGKLHYIHQLALNLIAEMGA